MSDTNETIADIIAEMRRIGLPRYDYTAGDMEADRRHFADRLEAAHKREVQNALDVGGFVEASRKNKQVGNAAKLREALKHIKDRLPHMLQYMRVHWEDASAGGYFDELMLVINAALSAPPRNCDKYATADEALKAQEQMFNDSNFANGECKLGCPECDNPRVGCKIAWLFAPATEKEGVAK